MATIIITNEKQGQKRHIEACWYELHSTRAELCHVEYHVTNTRHVAFTGSVLSVSAQQIAHRRMVRGGRPCGGTLRYFTLIPRLRRYGT